MNLEDLNNDYLRLSSALKGHEAQLQTHETNLKAATTKKETAETNLKGATTKSDKRQYQKDLNDAITEIENIKAQVELVKGQIEKDKERIEQIIKDVKEMPEVREQCNRTLDVRTERQIKKFEKQKKEQEEKKATLEEFKKMIAKHPQATVIVNNIESKSIGIRQKETEIAAITKKISELDSHDPNYATNKAKLDADKAKLEGEKTILITDRDKERADLKKLFNNPKYNECIDNFTTRAGLDKDINNCDRLIRRSENKIHDYTYTRNNLYKEQSTAAQTQTQTKWEIFKGLFKKREPGDPSKWESFKSLFKKQQALPLTTTPTTPTTSFKDEIKVNGDIMRNEVVQEVINQELSEKMKDAQKER